MPLPELDTLTKKNFLEVKIINHFHWAHCSYWFLSPRSRKGVGKQSQRFISRGE